MNLTITNPGNGRTVEVSGTPEELVGLGFRIVDAAHDGRTCERCADEDHEGCYHRGASRERSTGQYVPTGPCCCGGDDF